MNFVGKIGAGEVVLEGNKLVENGQPAETATATATTARAVCCGLRMKGQYPMTHLYAVVLSSLTGWEPPQTGYPQGHRRRIATQPGFCFFFLAFLFPFPVYFLFWLGCPMMSKLLYQRADPTLWPIWGYDSSFRATGPTSL